MRLAPGPIFGERDSMKLLCVPAFLATALAPLLPAPSSAVQLLPDADLKASPGFADTVVITEWLVPW